MMRVFRSLLIGILLFALSGCTLASNDDYYVNVVDEDKKDVSDYYIPAGIEFTLYEGSNRNQEIDVSDYFYVSFNCEDMTVFDNCIAVDYGSSIESAGTNFNMENFTENGVELPSINTITIDLTFFALTGSDLYMYSTFIMENQLGDKRYEQSTSFNFLSGVSIFGVVEGETMNGDKYNVDFTFNIETIDQLNKVTIRQFDKNDVLLDEKVVMQDSLVSEMTLLEETDYYFITEEFRGLDNILYQERIYLTSENPYYFLYKYTNEFGFLDGDRLIINPYE